MKDGQKEAEFSIARLRNPGVQLPTYVRSNRSAIVNYGRRYRARPRVATKLAESAVNSLVGKRMVKKQQLRWSLHGAHMLMQVRTADPNGELRDRLREPGQQEVESSSLFEFLRSASQSAQDGQQVLVSTSETYEAVSATLGDSANIVSFPGFILQPIEIEYAS